MPNIINEAQATTMSKIIVMIGAPGAGKGTQARLLSEKFGYPQISTGDILREMARAETELGKEIKNTLASGNLVSDQILAEVISSRTSYEDCSNGFILDGYPRTLEQARNLEDLAASQGKQILLVHVMVREDVLFQRMTGRRVCTKCGEIYNIYSRPPKRDGYCDIDGAPLRQRSDDLPETVSRRFEAYRIATAPLIEYYRQGGRLIEIDGDRPVEAVFEELSAIIMS
ncbi:MAG: adenylate kinase [Blastocatellia bacterium]|nr:adenylate kinase [Blastocatellia bacterium]